MYERNTANQVIREVAVMTVASANLTVMEQSCYRHPDHKTRVSCSACGRPICPDCMIPSPVGMRCPDCLAKAPSTKRKETSPRGVGKEAPKATIVLIVICLIAFLVSGGWGGEGHRTAIFFDGALAGIPITELQYWRLVSYGFLHSGIMHIGFNMLLLWFLGSELERELGSVKFLFIYFAALLGGACGALLLSPHAITVGASGAIYGLMGAASIILYLRGVNPFSTGIGMLLIFNLLISFVIPGVSIGGHIGGLIAGALAGLIIAKHWRLAIFAPLSIIAWATLAVIIAQMLL